MDNVFHYLDEVDTLDDVDIDDDVDTELEVDTLTEKKPVVHENVKKIGVKLILLLPNSFGRSNIFLWWSVYTSKCLQYINEDVENELNAE